MNKPVLSVVCAIIVQNKHILAVQKGPHPLYSGLWEFPGGKIQKGESDSQAVIREIVEELSVRVLPVMKLDSVFWEEQKQIIRLIPFISVIERGSIQLKEHRDMKWVPRNELKELSWVPADQILVSQVQQLLDAI